MLHAFGSLFFFFNDTATTEIYTLSLHDALPICALKRARVPPRHVLRAQNRPAILLQGKHPFLKYFRLRSEEHTSELQSHLNLVCRLLLEKKKKQSRR